MQFLYFRENFYSAQLKSMISIPDKAWILFITRKTPKSLRITYAILLLLKCMKIPQRNIYTINSNISTKLKSIKFRDRIATIAWEVG